MPRKNELTPEDLFKWANEYARTSENSGHGTRYPTLRMATRRYGISQARIEELLEEGTDQGYLGLAVGARNGVGAAVFETRGECLIEAYA